jgi:hypothetical protein
MIIYIAGPYRSKWGKLGIIRNIWKARKVAAELWRMGHTPICPHLNSALMDGIVPDRVFLEGDIKILKRCDAIVMMPEWRDSEGAKDEAVEAANFFATRYDNWQDRIFFWRSQQLELRVKGGSIDE